MKRFYGKILIFIIVQINFSFSNQENTLEKIKKAIEITSSTEIINFLQKNSEINIENKLIKGNDNETEMALKKFFENNPSKEINFIHEGDINNQITYILANYKTINDNYTIVVFVKNISETLIISRLIINKE